MNKKPLVFRTCIVTRKLLPKSELFRIVKTNSGVYFDLNQKIQGRGVYISKDLATIKLAHDKHSLSRGLRCEVDEKIYIELIQALGKERR